MMEGRSSDVLISPPRRGRVLTSSIIVVIIIATIVISIFIHYVLCPPFTYYAIASNRSTTPPPQYVTLNWSDLTQYALLALIIDGFENPERYPGMTLTGYNLTYEFDENSWASSRAYGTYDYLENRLLNKYGTPVSTPYHFAYFSTEDNRTYYYSWRLAVEGRACGI